MSVSSPERIAYRQGQIDLLSSLVEVMSANVRAVGDAEEGLPRALALAEGLAAVAGWARLQRDRLEREAGAALAVVSVANQG